MAETAPLSWSNIPLELAGLVLRCLDSHVDRVRFAAVCPQWRVAAREIPLPPPLPLLALPDGTVYSLPGRQPFHVPACSGYTEACGVCQPGAFSWWSMHLDDQSPIFFNITFHHGNLYALDHCGGVLVSVDVSTDHNTGDPWISRVRRVIDDYEDEENEVALDFATSKDRFLVELHGRMLMVERVMHHRWKIERSFETMPRSYKNVFEVFEANFERSQWSKVTTIGDDQVLFLRSQCCRFVCVSQYQMLGDLIFFLENGVKDDMGNGDEDDNRYCEERLGPCRVYDMRDGKVSDPLPTVPWTRAFALATWLSPQGLN
ncbi:hypothetical protein HU200_013365 [Digitaria exilis]|uniref:KIB1-4 beta-propeller domain-containing protein n=1 Tax=Digitaria exilis TaxID=1010633 RepID=A0A835FDR2_9POAL|nr:hypothetical protein HU200_013365 [Digitaria exilis]